MTIEEFAGKFTDCGMTALEYDLAMRIVSGQGIPELSEYAAYQRVEPEDVLMAYGDLVQSRLFRLVFDAEVTNG